MPNKFIITIFMIGLCVNYSISASMRVFTNAGGDAVKVVGSAQSLCGVSGVTLLSSSSSSCLRSTTPQGTPVYTSSSCPSQLVNVNSVFCIPNFCFASNPATQSIYALNSTDWSITSSFGSSTLLNPNVVSALSANATGYYNVLVADFDGSKIIVYRFAWNIVSVSVDRLAQITSTNAAAGIFYVPGSTTSFVISAISSTNLQIYNTTGTLYGSFGSFGSITHISADFYGQVYVYDQSCSCITVLSSAGSSATVVDTWPTNSVIGMSHSRDSHFIVDNTGVLRYSYDLAIQSYNVTNPTCLARGSSMSIYITGGASPYTYSISPILAIKKTSTLTYTNFISLNRPATTISNLTIYSESSINGPFSIISNSISNASSTAISPHSGLTSYSVKLGAGTYFYFYCSGCYQATYWSGVELWINVGLGGQSFTISVDGVNAIPFTFRPGNLPLNTWTRLYFDFSLSITPKTTFSYVIISEIGGNSNNNPLYFDDVVLANYPSYRPIVTVTDFCNVAVSTPELVISNSEVLRAEVAITPTTCNAGSYDGAKGFDGSLFANVTGGVAPYRYQWSFTNQTTATLSNLWAMRSNAILYTNSVNTSWVSQDVSVGPIRQDPTYYHSAPYSYSFQSRKTSDQIKFSIIGPGLNVNLYSAFEFWVNAGPTGGQTLAAVVIYGVTYMGSTYSLATLAGLPSLPINTWVKCTLPIPVSFSNPTFDGFIILGQASVPQPRAYFDDIMLLSKDLTLTVFDSNGCNVTYPYVNVTSPDIITPIITPQAVKCFKGSDGSVSLNVTGGNQPYQYSWSVGGSTASNTTYGLPESTVYANVTDANGCHSPVPVMALVQQPPALSHSAVIASPKCYRGSGTITVNAIGGTGPYSYIWTSTSNYTIQVQPNPFPIFIDDLYNGFALSGSRNASIICYGYGAFLNLGGFSVSHGGYCSMLISPPSNASAYQGNVNLDALGAPANSAVMVQLGCSECIDTTIYYGMELWISGSDLVNMSLWLVYKNTTVGSTLYFTNNTVNSTSTDWQKIYFQFDNVTSPRADYVMLLSTVPQTMALLDDIVLLPIPSQSDSLVTGLDVNTGFSSIVDVIGGGLYHLEITDYNGCPLHMNFTISSPDELTIVESYEGGLTKVVVAGGVPPYSYFWSNGLTTTSVDVPEGSYAFMVIDSNGCAMNKTIVVAIPAASQTALIAGVISGVSVVVVGAVVVILFFVWRKQRHVVQALLEAEEGERRAFKIDFESLDFGPVLGEGSFGEVFRGEYKGTDVAIKKLKKQQMTKKQLDEFTKESAVMVGLRHPNILLFMGVCLEPERLCVVTEMMPRGDLCDLLKNKDINIPVYLIYKMALDTLKGLQFIHSSGVVHRDLKSPNLLVDASWNIKISDFGLSCAQEHLNSGDQVSLLWTAPEILAREKDCHSFKSDMFSFGVILWELMSKEVPWDGVPPASITAKVVGGIRPAIGEEWDTNIVSLINTSWAQDPQARPSVKDARTMFEKDIIPTVADLGFASMTYSDSMMAPADKSEAMRAPPPQPPFAYVVINIAHATELWEQDPRGMSHAIEMLLSTLTKISGKLSGYEVSADSIFQYAFANPINAINFCLKTLLAMQELKYSDSLLALPLTKEQKNAEGTVLHRGLRLMIGIHWCSPTLRRDPVTGLAAYAGASIPVAQAISRSGSPDSFMVDQDIYCIIMSPNSVLELEAFSLKPAGARQVAGKEMHLFKVVVMAQKDLLEEEVEEDGANSSMYSPEPWMVNFEDFTMGKVIGVGSFGDVMAGTYLDKRVAIKKFVRTKLAGKLLLEMRTECAILQSLQHPNILKFVGMCLQPPNLCLLTEIMEQGSLGSVLTAKGELPWTRRIAMAKDIAKGMAYLHANNIIHRDVKSSNLLVANDWTVKIADFGFSRIRVANQTMTQCGTVAWTAPEVFDSSRYTNKADVYSYAVVIWEIIFRTKPWQGKHAMKIISTVEGGGRLPINNMPADAPNVLKGIMVSCWDQSPESRPSFEQVLQEF